MVTCAVPGCKSARRNNPHKYTFHVFPLDVVVREKWIRMVHREDWVPKKYSVVCSKHFEQKCFSEGAEQRVKLRTGSVPTLFMPIKLTSRRNASLYSDISALPTTGSINTKFSESCLQNQKIEPENSVTEGTMSEDALIHEVKQEMCSECRTCLQPLNADEDLYYIFQNWVSPWEGVDDTIAEALQRIAHIQLSDMDPHSKVICGACCQKLHMASLFANLVQQSDYTLRQRNPGNSDTDIDENWPKPIQIDKNIPFDEQKDIKQENLSDEEYSSYSGVDATNSDVGGMDIKIEPVELIPQQEIPLENGHCEGMSPDEKTPEISVNGDESSQEHYNEMVKEEPVSDSESIGTDLSLDCMLCSKVLNSVSGLKAHVIAHHSYKSVRRKAANETSPAKRQKLEHVCVTCRRSFATSTDLMVHETCHNKSVCYGCNEKFDSFELVMQHRLTCKAVNNREHGPVKTLEDVQRPQRSSSANSEDSTKDLLKCSICGESFTDNYYMNIHLEIHHPVPAISVANEEEMEVDALESLFSERA